MDTYSTTRVVFFSPTHTSARIARAVAEGIGMGRRIETDLTLDLSDTPIPVKNELTVIAAPVYGGRVAPVALQRIRRLQAENSPAILITVYGNRDYEDALLELRDTAAGLGFTPLSAGAFIGENSYSSVRYPVAAGRPDAADLQKAVTFGKESLEKLRQAENTPSILAESFFIKGHSPYKVVQAGKPSCPVCNEHCFVCGECIDVCPTRAISVSDDGSRIETDINRCIRCCACVKVCPNQARIYDNPFAAILHEKCSTRREPELFL